MHVGDGGNCERAFHVSYESSIAESVCVFSSFMERREAHALSEPPVTVFLDSKFERDDRVNPLTHEPKKESKSCDLQHHVSVSVSWLNELGFMKGFGKQSSHRCWCNLGSNEFWKLWRVWTFKIAQKIRGQRLTQS